MRLALFDLDHTLLSGDSDALWCEFLLARGLLDRSTFAERNAQVEQGRRRNSEVKRFVHAELERMGLKYIPSHANFVMINLRRQVKPVIAALRAHQVEVGRVFPAMPEFMRVTIGTKPQMDAFVSALREVIS